MNARTVLAGLWRRWYVTLAGILLTAGLGWYALQSVSPTYERSATVVLIPGTATVTEGDNPFLYLGGLTQARDVLVRSLAAPEVREPILQANPGGDFSAAAATGTGGPFVVLTTTSGNAAQSLAILEDALAAVPTTLDQLQDEIGAPEDSRITTLTLTVDRQPTASQRQRLRLTGVAVAAGLLATTLGASLIDGLLGARATRRSARRRTTGTPETPQRPAQDVTSPAGQGDGRRARRERGAGTNRSTEIGGTPVPDSDLPQPKQDDSVGSVGDPDGHGSLEEETRETGVEPVETLSVSPVAQAGPSG